jgi:phosphate butyryltransferase
VTGPITSFADMIAAARQAGPLPIVVAAAHDPEVLKAVDWARGEGIVEPTLVGDWPAIEAYAAQTGTALTDTAILHEPDPVRAARQAVSLARQGQVGAVVKGQVKTAELLSVVLNRHVGIRGRGLVTHVALFELPGLDRLIYLSDSGVVVYPDVYQKLEIINNVVSVAHRLGLVQPKVAILAASDTVHPKIPASIDALALAKMAEQGWVQGPSWTALWGSSWPSLRKLPGSKGAPHASPAWPTSSSSPTSKLATSLPRA